MFSKSTSTFKFESEMTLKLTWKQQAVSPHQCSKSYSTAPGRAAQCSNVHHIGRLKNLTTSKSQIQTQKGIQIQILENPEKQLQIYICSCSFGFSKILYIVYINKYIIYRQMKKHKFRKTLNLAVGTLKYSPPWSTKYPEYVIP